MNEHIGEIAALATSVFWTFTALAFEHAARRVGSLALNILRLAVALCIFAVLGLVVRGEAVPLGAGGSAWFWLTLSGLVGFVFGDIFLFQAYIDIGARTTQLIFASAPLLTAVIGFFALGERVAPLGGLGMAMVVAGIALVILDKGSGWEASPGAEPRIPAARRLRGALWAFLGAVGQAGGLILSKIGAPASDPFAATQIRVIAGLAGFLVLALLWRRLGEPVKALKDRSAMGSLAIGSFFGPFLGVSLGLFAVQRAASGVAATLMGLTPILILVPAVLIKKERVTFKEALGAVVAVAGSAFLFLS
jgi:drug/metabolite transporter (DMT)-like permease